MMLNNSTATKLGTEVHRRAWIVDLLTIPVRAPRSDPLVFTLGEVPLQAVSVVGRVLAADSRTQSYWIDDGSGGVLHVDLAHATIQQPHRLVGGALVEVLGRLDEVSAARRVVRARVIDTKDDPMFELFRIVDLMRLYKLHYFMQGHPRVTIPILCEMPSVGTMSKSPLKQKQSDRREEQEEIDVPMDAHFQRQLEPGRVESYIQVNHGISLRELIAYFRCDKESVEGILVNVSVLLGRN